MRAADKKGGSGRPRLELSAQVVVDECSSAEGSGFGWIVRGDSEALPVVSGKWRGAFSNVYVIDLWSQEEQMSLAAPQTIARWN